MFQNTLFQKEKDEEQRVENLCAECNKKPKVWDINVRDKCKDCLRKHFLNEFFKIGVNKKGYQEWGDSYLIYSHTTARELISKKRILAVGYGIFCDGIFDYIIQTCDEFGCFEHCFGITTEFAKYLIKKMKFVKGDDSMWINPKIIKDEKAKKIFEFEEKIEKQREELDEELSKLGEMKNAN